MGSVKSDVQSRPVYSYDSQFWLESAPPYAWPQTPAPTVQRDSTLPTTDQSHVALPSGREPVEVTPKIKTESTPVSTDTSQTGAMPPDKWPTSATNTMQQVSSTMVPMNIADHNAASMPRVEGAPPQDLPKLPDMLTEAQMAAAQQNHMRRLVTAPGVMLAPGVAGGGDGQSDLFHKVPLGEKGRMELKAAIRAAMKERPELREKVNGIAKLRCATIPQLLRIAHICDLWDMALEISRRFVETRNGKQSRQAAIRKMAKSGCLIDRRLGAGLSTTVSINGSPQQVVTTLPLNKSIPIRIITKPAGPILNAATFTQGPPPPEYGPPPVCGDAASVATSTTSPGTSVSQQSAAPSSVTNDDAQAAWSMQGNADSGYNTAVTTEWQPLEQSYYEMYGANSVYTGTPTNTSSNNTTQWATPMPQPSTPHPQPTYYQPQVAPATSSCEAVTVTAVAPPVTECPTRVDGVCLYGIDQTLASGVPPSIASPPNENPAVEQLAAISQFGLWAAEATPGFV